MTHEDSNTDLISVVNAILESINDQDVKVNEALQKSICKIAVRPNVDIVLITFCEFFKHKDKLNIDHAGNILCAMEQICIHKGQELNPQTVDVIIEVVIKQMTSNLDYVPCMQNPASGILACIGCYHCEKVMIPLMALLKPTDLPHYTIPHTIGSLARMNIEGIQPFIKKILGKMLPTINMVKHNPIKQAYSYAFANMSTALLDYFNNQINGEVNEINKDNYKAEFSMIYDILSNNWLQSSEPRVVENILSAIGPMINLISFDKHTELMPRIIVNVLSLYRKLQIDPHCVTEALSYILKRSVCFGDLLNSTTVDIVISNIFPYVLTMPDYDQPQKVKNHFEVLRCFDTLFSHSKNTIEYLNQRAKSNNEEERMKAIVVLTHLLSFSEKTVTDNFIRILNEIIDTETTVKMKRILLKAIVALAYKQGLGRDKNTMLLNFIIKQINNPQNNESLELYNDCENALYLLSSTVKDIKPILWPILLKSLMVCKQTNSIGVLMKSLLYLVQMTDGDEETNELENSSIPSNELIFVRCMSLLNVSNVNSNTKDLQFIINFLLKYCTIIHKDLGINWELDLKNLSTFLDSNDINDTTWEPMLIDLFRSAIYLVNDNSWIDNVSKKILEQIPSQNQSLEQKGILYKYFGVLLCNMIDGDRVQSHLDIYFNAIPNVSTEEGTYIAEALGIASIKHGMRIIEKLDELAKGILTKKASRFFKFNFMKNSKNEIILNNMKYIITLSYGMISKELLDINILNKLVRTEVKGDGTAMSWICEILQNYSNPSLTYAGLTTLDLFTKSIHSMSHSNIILHERKELIDLISFNIVGEIVIAYDSDIFPTIIKTISSLINLPKFFTPQERNKLLKDLFQAITVTIAFSKTETNDFELDPTLSSSRIKNIQNAFDSLIRDFTVQITCPSTLDDILSILDPWINNENEDIRITAMTSTHKALQSFIENITLTYENPSRFNQSGVLLGRMLSKCTDTSFTIRTIAIESIKVIIQIIDLYEGRTTSPQSESLHNLEFEIISNHPDQFKNTLTIVTHIVCDKIQQHQIMLLIVSLMANLEVNNTPKQESCIALKTIFKYKGQDLYQHVNDIMDLILGTARKITSSKKDHLLRAMLAFTKHHAKSVVEFLLTQPLPFDAHTNDCWKIITEDKDITAITIEYFLNILSTQPLYAEIPKSDSPKVVSVQCLAVISALCEMLMQPHTKEICNERFTDIFSTLYITLFSLIGTVPPAQTIPNKKIDKYALVPNNQSTKLSPVKVTVDTLKALLISFGCVKIFDIFSMCTEMDSISFIAPFLDYIASIVKIFCEDYPEFLLKMVTSLNQHARANLIPQRLAVVAFFSNLVAFRCNDNYIMLETVIATLNAGWLDTALEVRAVSLSGLGNIKYLKKEQRNPLMQNILTLLYRGLEDHQGSNPRNNIPLVAMISLTELLTEEEPNNHLTDSFTPIAQRIKAFMNTENPSLREASIRLFGEIVQKRKSDALKEQAFILFPCFLLHLADGDVNVIKACKQTLRKIAPTFDAPNTNSMIQNHMIDAANLHINDFLTDLIKCVAGELPMNVHQLIESTTNYLNSPWDNIRAYSCIMIGLLFANYDKNCHVENDYEKTKKALTFRLIQLIKDKNPAVRMAAAAALSGPYQSL